LGGDPISGAFDVTCDPGTEDVNGKRTCQCSLQALDPLEIPGIGFVCVSSSGGSCPDGEMDCDGGNALDVDIVAEHTAGVCTSNTDCDSQCGTYCGGIGKSVHDSGCESFCQAGTRADLPCICDVAGAATCVGGVAGANDCPGGNCEGKDNDPAPDQCHCTCIDAASGGASAAGTVSCSSNFSVTIESSLPCDGSGVLVRLPDRCATLTSGSATGVILNANEGFSGTFGPYSESGATGTCSNLDAGVTAGYELVAVLAFFDSTIGDLAARFRIDCE
jgi:hypothetical protein